MKQQSSGTGGNGTAESFKPSLPFGWTVRQSKTYPDRVYYFNVNTGATTWEPPSFGTIDIKESATTEKLMGGALSKLVRATTGSDQSATGSGQLVTGSGQLVTQSHKHATRQFVDGNTKKETIGNGKDKGLGKTLDSSETESFSCHYGKHKPNDNLSSAVISENSSFHPVQIYRLPAGQQSLSSPKQSPAFSQKCASSSLGFSSSMRNIIQSSLSRNRASAVTGEADPGDTFCTSGQAMAQNKMAESKKCKQNTHIAEQKPQLKRKHTPGCESGQASEQALGECGPTGTRNKRKRKESKGQRKSKGLDSGQQPDNMQPGTSCPSASKHKRAAAASHCMTDSSTNPANCSFRPPSANLQWQKRNNCDPQNRGVYDQSYSKTVPCPSCNGVVSHVFPCTGLSPSSIVSKYLSENISVFNPSCEITAFSESNLCSEHSQAAVTNVSVPGNFGTFSIPAAVSPTTTANGSHEDFDMEVDADGDAVMTDIQQLRENFCTSKAKEVLGLLTDSVHQQQQWSAEPVTSPTIVTSPTSVTSPTTAPSKLVYVVIDTNVLISALPFVQTLRDGIIRDYGRPFIIIPWVVLQELDAIKDSRFKSSSCEMKARAAVSYLHVCLVAHHPRVKGQTPQEASEVVGNLVSECNDDRVLQCVLQCQKQYCTESVLLLTDDKNLINKAMVMDIKCLTSKLLSPLLVFDYAAAGSNSMAQGVDGSAKYCSGMQAIIQQTFPSTPLTPAHSTSPPADQSLVRGLTPNRQQASQLKSQPLIQGSTLNRQQASQLKSQPLIQGSTLNRQQASQLKSQPLMQSPTPDKQQGSQHKSQSLIQGSTPNRQPQLRMEMDEVLGEACRLILSALSARVERELREAYGKEWTDVVCKKPPWSPHDLLLVLYKHWQAMMGWGMERNAYQHVEDLARRLRPSSAVVLGAEEFQKLMSHCLHLIRASQTLSESPQALVAMDRLVERGQQLCKAWSTWSPQTPQQVANACSTRSPQTPQQVANVCSTRSPQTPQQVANTRSTQGPKTPQQVANVCSKQGSQTSQQFANVRSTQGPKTFQQFENVRSTQGPKTSQQLANVPSTQGSKTSQQLANARSTQGLKTSQQVANLCSKQGSQTSQQLAHVRSTQGPKTSQQLANVRSTQGPKTSQQVANTCSTRSPQTSQQVANTPNSFRVSLENNQQRPPLRATSNLSSSSNTTSVQNKSFLVTQPKPQSEENLNAVPALFQAVWVSMFNLCNQFEKAVSSAGSLSSADIANMAEVYHRIIPIIQHISEQFKKSLSFSPLVLENNMKTISELCSCLNNFYVHTQLQPQPVTPVSPDVMLEFMLDTTHRVTLFNGLRQLEDFVKQLDSLGSHILTLAQSHH